MSAPKGNKFWELRSKHGRDKLFATPELMWEAACEYFQWCIDNPFYKVEQARSGGKKKAEVSEDGIRNVPSGLAELPVMRPFTIQGLCLYLDCSVAYFRNFEKNNKNAKDFITVIERINETIYKQKFEGAASGFFNANIIARDLGLSDKKETKHDTTENFQESIKTLFGLNNNKGE